MRRLRRAAAWILGLVGGGVLLVGAILFGLVGTASGARWLLARLTPETAEIASVQGSLLGSLRLEGVSVGSPTLSLRVDSVRLDLSLARLLAREVVVRRLEVAGAELRSTGAAAERRREPGPPRLTLPLPVRFRRAEARRVTLRTARGDTTGALERALLSASAGPDGIRVDSLGLQGISARGARVDARLRGEIGGAPPHPVRASLRWTGRLPDGNPVSGRGKLSGDLDEARAALGLRAPLIADGFATLHRPFEALRWTGTLRIPGADLRTVSPSLPDLRAEATIEAGGAADSLGAEASLTAVAPGGASLPGRLVVTWRPGHLTVDTASLGLPARDGSLGARGRFELGGERPRGELSAEWSNLAWPFTGEATVLSSEGSLSAEGEASGIAFQGATSLRGPSLPAAEWRVDGRASRTGDTLRARAEIRTLVRGMPPVRTTVRGDRTPERVTLEEVVTRVDGTPMTIQARGEIRTGDGSPGADLRVQWQEVGWPLSGEARYASPRGSMRIRGTAERFRVAVDAAADAEPLPEGRWRGAVTGGRSDGTLRARADLLGELAEVGEVRIAGRLTRSPDRVLVHELTARAPASGASLRLEGELRPGAELPLVAARARWTDLAWPLSGTPRLTSARGLAEAESRRGRLHLRTELSLAGTRVPEGRWRLSGSATADRVVLDTIRAELLGGRLGGRAVAERDSVVRWSTEIRGEELDPAAALAQWPGSLGLELDAAGAWGGPEPRTSVERLAVEGTLRARPFSALLRGEVRGDRVRADTLALRSRSASVEGRGVIGETVNVFLRVDAPDLADLVPGARGGALVAGSVDGSRSRPRLHATVRGAELAYGELALDSVRAEVAVDLSDAEASSLSLRSLGVRSPTLALDSAWIDGSGFAAGHTLALGAARGPEALGAAARGRWDGRAWEGALTGLDLESARAGRWTLDEPAPLFLSRDSAALGSACWTSAGEGELCLGGGWAPGPEARWRAAGRAIPLAFLDAALPDALALDGTADLETTGRLTPGSAPSGHLRVEAESAALRYRIAGDEVRRREISALQVDATADPAGVRGDGELRLADGDHLRLEAESGPAGAGERGVRARLTADLRDRGLVEAVTAGALTETRGHLLVDLSASGTLSRPALDGSVRLVDAGAVAPLLGIRIEGIGLEARPVPGGERFWSLSAGAASGRGDVALDGSLRLPGPAVGWSLDTRLTGRDFEAYRTSLGHLVVSPDLGLVADPDGIAVEGRLGVPVGRITTASFPSAVHPAPDVRVLAATEDADEPAASLAWPPVRARVRVVLGEEIAVDAMGLNAELGGELTVLTEPQRPPVANGTLEIERGSYSAYGQRLTIDRGRVVYVQSPLDDPSLDLRIVRESQGVIARMDVAGTVRRPRITLSSEPSLADDEILAYLLLGRPVSELSQREGRMVQSVLQSLGLRGGNLLVARLGAMFGLQEARIETNGSLSDASLVLGRQVLPRVQVDYAIGLLGSANVLRIRYILGRGWSIQTENGREVSVDLLYEIGR